MRCSRLFDTQPGNKYYVSPTGHDENRGSLARPWKTIAKVNAEQFEPGDQILFKGDSQFDGTIVVDKNDSATAENNIVISSYGEGQAIINGEDSLGFYAHRTRHFTLKNLIFRGSGRLSGNSTDGVLIVQSDSFTVENVGAHGFQHSGIHLRKCVDATINNCLAHENGFSGIYISGEAKRESNHFDNKNLLIKNCVAENNAGDPTVTNNHSGNGILVGGAQHVLIDHCVATNNGWDMPRTGNGPVGIWAYQSDLVTIQYCLSYKNKTSPGAKDGGGFDFDGGMTNSVIQYCLSYENEGAGFGLFQYPGADDWYNNQLRYNISLNDGKTTDGAGGIFVWNGGSTAREMRDCYVYHNVIFNEYKPAVVFEPASKHENFNFNNNIFVGIGNLVAGPTSGDQFLGNVWWKAGSEEVTFRDYQSLEEWAIATGQEEMDDQLVGMQVDPQFRGPILAEINDPDDLRSLIGFQLTNLSPAINQGVDLEALLGIDLPEFDYYGNELVQGSAPEPGIFELDEAQL